MNRPLWAKKRGHVNVLCECSSNGDLSRGRFQESRMTHSVDTSQLLFPATPVTAQFMNNMAMVVEMKVIHGLSNVDFLSSRPPLSAQSARGRDQH